MKLYAGNLSANTTEDDLRRVFSAHGTVDSCRLAMDRDTNKPRGFGFIEMNKDDEANAAITSLNGTDLGGNTIKVIVAVPKAETVGSRT